MHWIAAKRLTGGKNGVNWKQTDFTIINIVRWFSVLKSVLHTFPLFLPPFRYFTANDSINKQTWFNILAFATVVYPLWRLQFAQRCRCSTKPSQRQWFTTHRIPAWRREFITHQIASWLTEMHRSVCVCVCTEQPNASSRIWCETDLNITPKTHRFFTWCAFTMDYHDTKIYTQHFGFHQFE